MHYYQSTDFLLVVFWVFGLIWVFQGAREDVQHQTPDYRLVVDRKRYDGDSYRVQRKVGRRWETLARGLDHSDGYWLANRLQWPRSHA